MSSVAQIVRQIIEQLSDGVSQLVLMVVVLQEQNAEVPPQLPQASSAVMQTAATLGKVAVQLANTNYKNFPDIAKEIVDSASAVNDANSTMQKAMQSLNAVDRKQGWTGLVDACRVMSGKTIKLLQIVYGAELKRLYAVADDLLKGLGKLDTNQAKTDPQGFADGASDLASKAAQLANFIQARAKDEESPLLKEQLLNQSKQLDEKANQLIEAVNDLLQDPDDPAKQQKVKDLLKELQDLIANTANAINENQTELPDTDESTLPSLNKAIADRKAKQEAEEAARAEEEERKRREEEERIAREEAEAAAARPQGFNLFEPVAAPLDKSAVERQIKNLREAAKKLADDAVDGDPAASAKSGDDLVKKTNELKKDVKDIAAKSNDDQKKKQIDSTLKELDKLVGDELTKAKNTIENPTADNKKAVQQAAKNISDLLNELKDETKPASLNENAKKLEDLTNKLNDAVKKGDDKAINDLLKQIDDLHKLIEQQGKWQTQNASDPKKQKELADALNKLNQLLKDLEKDAKSKDKAKTDADVQKVKTALKDLVDKTNAEPQASLDSVLRDLERIKNAANRGDQNALKDAANALKDHSKDLFKKANDAANKSQDPEEKKRILDKLKTAENALGRQLEALKRVLANPNDQQAKDDLEQRTKEFHDALKDLNDTLRGVDKAVDNAKNPFSNSAANPAAVNKTVNDIQDKLKSLQDLENKLKSNPKDKKAQDELKSLMDLLDKASGGLLSGVSRDSEDQVTAKAEELKTIADQLKDAVDRGDKKGADNELKHLAKAEKDFQELLKKEAEKQDDPAKKLEIENAAKGVNHHYNNTLKSAKEALEKMNDPSKKTELAKAVEGLKNAADRATDIVRPHAQNERVMRDAAKDIVNDMDKINKAAHAGDKKGVDDGLKKLEKDGRRFLKAAEKRKGYVPPENGPDPMEELRRLWNTIGHPARELANNPQDKKYSNELQDIIQQAKNNLRKVNDKHNVDAVAAVQDVGNSFDKLNDAVQRNDAPAVAAEAKELVRKTNDLVPLVQQEQDQSKRQKLIDAVNDLNGMVKQTLADAGEALKDPENKGKKDKVKEDVDKAKVPIAKMISTLSPGEDHKVKESIQDAVSKNSELGGALRDGDPNKIKDALAKDKTAVTKAIDDAKKLNSKETDPFKRQLIDDALKSLADTLAKMSKPGTSNEDLKRFQTDLDGLLGKLGNLFNSDTVDLVAKDRGKTAAIAAKIRDAVGDEMDLSDLLKAAGDLSNNLKNMLGEATTMARSKAGDANLSDAARAALDLDTLFTQIEKSAVTDSSKVSTDLDSLLGQLNGLVDTMKPKEEPKTFEDVLEHAAVQITKAVKQATTDNKSSEGVASELMKLAAAARAGKRQEMLVASRAVAAHILAVVNELTAVVKRMGNKNPREADSLIRATTALRNFATQLKILTSVKAASIETDNDNDESLTSITRNLGSVLSNAIFTMDAVKITVLKEKK